jgi:hypothetical protein
MSSSTKLGVIVFGAAGGLFLLAVVGVVLARGRGAGAGVVGPSSSTPTALAGAVQAPVRAAEWTHADLAEYLRSRGVRPLAVAASQKYPAAAWFVLDDKEPRLNAVLAMDEVGTGRGCLVSVDSPEAIRAEIGRHGNPADLFGWGKFFFRGPPDVVARFRAALTSP